jgi:hypothetical protein
VHLLESRPEQRWRGVTARTGRTDAGHAGHIAKFGVSARTRGDAVMVIQTVWYEALFDAEPVIDLEFFAPPS